MVSIRAEERGAVEPPTVLVVDDEPFNIDLLSEEIEDLGLRAVPASNGREALALIEERGCDMVLLDIMMPEMDGIELLERLHAAGRLTSLPVIVVSAVDDIHQVARCIELGAEDHLLKPFDPVLLRARVEKHKAFEQFLRIKSEEYREMHAKRVELRGGVESDNESDYTIIEEEEREMLETFEEIIDDGEEIEIGDD